MTSKQQIIDNIYKSVKNPGSFTNNVSALYKTIREHGHQNISKADIKRYLASEPSAVNFTQKKYVNASKAKIYG